MLPSSHVQLIHTSRHIQRLGTSRALPKIEIVFHTQISTSMDTQSGPVGTYMYIEYTTLLVVVLITLRGMNIIIIQHVNCVK